MSESIPESVLKLIDKVSRAMDELKAEVDRLKNAPEVRVNIPNNLTDAQKKQLLQDLDEQSKE